MELKPAWLEFSGLPKLLNAKVRIGAWSVFAKLVELDCERNRRPGLVELTVSELAERVGLKPEVVMRILKGLSKCKVAQSFIPEHPDEEMLFCVAAPLKAPHSRAGIEQRLNQAGVPGPWSFRYLDKESTEGASESALQEVVDAYFNAIGLKMNTFILDELRLLSSRFTLKRVKRAFALAHQRGIRQLGWVARELYRWERRDRQKEKQPTKRSP
jgi:hypothetical protein